MPASSPAVLEKAKEQDLPAHCALAFEQFERGLPEACADKPLLIERRLGEHDSAFFADYGALVPASWASILGMVLLLWVLVALVLGLVAVIVLTTVAEPVQGPATKILAAVGGVSLLGVAIWWIASEIAENRRKRARAGRVAYGTFFLAEAIVVRWARRCYYYPREQVLEVFEEKVTGTRPASNLGYRCCLRYVDAKVKERKTSVCLSDLWAPHPDGALIQHARRWFAGL